MILIPMRVCECKSLTFDTTNKDKLPHLGPTLCHSPGNGGGKLSEPRGCDMCA